MDHMEQMAVFKELLRKTNRDGIEKLLAYLEMETDFFTAPASSKYHEAYEGGLLEHSLNVYQHLKTIMCKYYKMFPVSPDTAYIVSLLHDVCKANFYSLEMRNKKIDGVWQQVPFYAVSDRFPAGHGEKSVMIVQRYIPLTDEEIMAINWHMGFSDIRTHEIYGMQALSNACSQYPLVVLLHMADLAATYLNGKKE